MIFLVLIRCAAAIHIRPGEESNTTAAAAVRSDIADRPLVETRREQQRKAAVLWRLGRQATRETTFRVEISMQRIQRASGLSSLWNSDRT